MGTVRTGVTKGEPGNSAAAVARTFMRENCWVSLRNEDFHELADDEDWQEEHFTASRQRELAFWLGDVSGDALLGG